MLAFKDKQNIPPLSPHIPTGRVRELTNPWNNAALYVGVNKGVAFATVSTIHTGTLGQTIQKIAFCN